MLEACDLLKLEVLNFEWLERFGATCPSTLHCPASGEPATTVTGLGCFPSSTIPFSNGSYWTMPEHGFLLMHL